MADLVRDFFEKDLSDREWERLGEILRDSPKEADRFLVLSRNAYAALRLPEPKWRFRRSAKRAYFKAALAGVAILACLAAWRLMQRPAAPSALRALPQAPAPAPVLRKKQAAPRRMGEDAPPPSAEEQAPPQESVAAEEHSELSVELTLLKPESVTVRILDAQGKAIRKLYSGTLAAGQWVFEWDGILEDGQRPGPGNYDIEVSASGESRRKRVEIRNEQEE